MFDRRWSQLGEILVNYSTRTRAGDRLLITMMEPETFPLTLAVYEHAVRAGAFPQVQFTSAYLERALLMHGSDEADRSRPRSRAQRDGVGGRLHRSARRPQPARAGRYPNRAAGRPQARAGRDLRPAQRADPLGPRPGPERGLRPSGRHESGRGDGRSFSTPPCATGRKNRAAIDRSATCSRPRRGCGSSVATPISPSPPPAAPTSSATATSTCPTARSTRRPSTTAPRVSSRSSIRGSTPGDRSAASASSSGPAKSSRPPRTSGEEFLQQILAIDDGARRIGEFGVGVNFGIDRFVGDILFDEKIGGTIHLALGRAYAECGGTNQSSLHWDLVKDLRSEGAIELDGRRVFENGRFLTGLTVEETPAYGGTPARSAEPTSLPRALLDGQRANHAGLLCAPARCSSTRTRQPGR